MGKGNERPGFMNRFAQRLVNGAIPRAARKRMLFLSFMLGCVLLIGLVLPRHHTVHHRARVLFAPDGAPQSPFETAFARAQQHYLSAQIFAKQQLEALEEWDGDSIRGSAPERYRRGIIARAREIGPAEVAAREAVRQATTNDEIYRATRLLLHVERDIGRSAAELELAQKLVDLRPDDPQARVLLEYARQGKLGTRATRPPGAQPGPDGALRQ